MGPDEEKDYNTPDVDGDISDILKELKAGKEYNMTFDAATHLYAAYELKLVRVVLDAEMNQVMVYDISKEYPSGIGSFLCRKDAIDCITSTYGSVISLFFGKLKRRFHGIMTNRSGNFIMLVKKLWCNNIKNGSSYIPKIVDAFDVFDKDDTVIILIQVR